MKKLGVYIHVPFCGRKCAYCDFVSGSYPSEVIGAYFSSLENEISSFDFSKYIVDSVFIGGGTPSLVPAEFISRAISRIKNISENAEITIECNPESFTQSKAKIYKNARINRISFGLQSANDKILKKIGRVHSADKFFKALDIAKIYFTNINADLMLGLPEQSTKDIIDTINKIAGQVQHISVYGLKVEPDTALQKEGYVVDEDLSAEMYETASAELQRFGYFPYEVSNFSLKGYECAHNKKYWDLSEYVGFGVAAHSYFNDNKNNVTFLRTENTSSIFDYIDGTRKVSSEAVLRGCDEDKREFIMLALRTANGISLAAYRRRFNIEFLTEFEMPIKKLSSLLNITEQSVCIKKTAFYVMNSIILEFFN